MPLNANILSLLRQQNPANSQPMAKGVDPNLEMILQAMGMMPRQLDMQGRPILSGVKNPSTMDQHYARQANPEAMKDRYSSPTFAMGANDPNRMAPATKLPGQGPIVAHQPVTGLPGQVGPAYSTQMTPINVFPSPTEGDAMDTVRKQYRETMFPTRTQSQVSPAITPSPTVGIPGYVPYQQGAGDWLRPLQTGTKYALSTGQYINDRQNAHTSLAQEYIDKTRPFVEMRARHRNDATAFALQRDTPGLEEARAYENWDVQNATPSLPEMFQYLTGVGKPWQPKVVPGRTNPARYSSLNR